MTPEALAHLSKSDRTLARLIARVGPCHLKPQSRRSPFEALVTAVAHQQLTGRVAEVILGRFRGLYEEGRFPTPEEVLRTPATRLRGAGFSTAKSAAIKDIALKTVDGLIPSTREVRRLSDEEIIERFTQVRGVGRWTVEMFLIFTLGRPDVWPVDDFGVRKGFSLAYKRTELPKPKELREFGEKWRPHRSTAAWYFWSATEVLVPAKSIR
ncbi:MAG TPA: DNA-3-methyladenine glycosylase 2 family protein [Verrucomicrobiales bacterium]|nr:DNA-3-methyladenine glycosylase 2 family protein [Verrucomicrobiales bacterium]